MAGPDKPQCKDCGSTTRKLNYPGPRCWTCWRASQHQRKLDRHDRHLKRHFNMDRDEYERIKQEQGGGCICHPWTGYNGNTRQLSVDHDHETGYIRGLLCKHCNDMLGRFRDSPEAFERAIEYLRNPPAQRVIGLRRVPDEENPVLY